MSYRAAAAVVAIALALPACGQHGAAHGGLSGHGGFTGHSGFAGHSGFVGHSGFSGNSGFSRPSAGAFRPSVPYGYSGWARPGVGRSIGPLHSGFRAPYRVNGSPQFRPPYRQAFGDRSRGRDRRRGFGGLYGYVYPGWPGYYPYPYVIDPGFYDWSDSGDSGYGEGGPTSGYAPYTDYGDAYPETPQAPYYAPQPYAQSPAPEYPGAASLGPAEEPLTLIFNNGRAPQKMQNYMMNSKALTDLDPQHYEQIPLDQIDVAATEQANRARGVDFQVPGTRQE